MAGKVWERPDAKTSILAETALLALLCGCGRSGLTEPAHVVDAGGPSGDAPAHDAVPDGMRDRTEPDATTDGAQSPEVDLDSLGQDLPGNELAPGALADGGPGSVSCQVPDGMAGCYRCSCGPDGQVLCLLAPCPTDAVPQDCLLPSPLYFGETGGRVAYQDQYQLDSANGLTIMRTYYGGSAAGSIHTCTPTLPSCGAPSVVSTATIVADLADPDVQAALASSSAILFGVDYRRVDGSVYFVTQASGGSMLVGAPCASQGDACTPIPAGVQRLVDDLRSLAADMTAQTPCWGL